MTRHGGPWFILRNMWTFLLDSSGKKWNKYSVCTASESISVNTSDMVEALKMLDWPNQVSASHRTSEGLAKLKAAIKKLSVFQPSGSSSTATVTLPSSEASGPLFPFKIMTKEIEIRFRFHFEGNRPTNNLEKVRKLRSGSNFSLSGFSRILQRRYNFTLTL